MCVYIGVPYIFKNYTHTYICVRTIKKKGYQLEKGGRGRNSKEANWKVRGRKQSKKSVASLLCGSTFSLEPPAANNAMGTYY